MIPEHHEIDPDLRDDMRPGGLWSHLVQSVREAPMARIGMRNTPTQPWESDRWAGVGDRIAAALARGRTLYAIGNGGSAAQAEHLVAELLGRFELPGRRPLRAMALTAPSSVITAIANDYGYECIYERQLMAHMSRGDVLVALTTSGTSSNVVRAMQWAATHFGDDGEAPETMRVAIVGGMSPLSGEHTVLTYATDYYLARATYSSVATSQEEHQCAIHALVRRIDRTVDQLDSLSLAVRTASERAQES